MWRCKCGEKNLNTAAECHACGSRKSDSENHEPYEKGSDDFWENQRLKAEKREREKLQQEHRAQIENLRRNGAEGYYEYKVLSLLDTGGFLKKDSGRVDVLSMTKVLNELGMEGWHLVTAYSNELGKNALSGGAGGAVFGVNSTVDENILIFERFVKIEA